MKITNIINNFILQNKLSIFGYLFFAFAVPLTNIYLPYLYGQVILEMNDTKNITSAVKSKLIIIVAMWFIIQAFWASMNMIDSYFIPKLRSHIRQYIIDTVIQAHRENYSEKELGWILAEIVRLPDIVAHMFSNIRNHILPMVYLLTFSIGYYVWTNPLLGGISILTIGCYITIAIKLSKKCNPILKEKNKCHRDLHNEINDCLGNLLSIYTESSEQSEKKRLDNYEKNFNDKYTNTIKCAGKLRFFLNITYVFLFVGINSISFYLYSQEKLQLNQVITSLIISLELISKMSNFVGSLDRIMSDLSTIHDSQQALDKLSDIQSQPSPLTPLTPLTPGDIIFQNVQIKYGDQIILNNFNYTFPYLSKTAIIGEIGTGKTTLINSLLRLYPYSGNINIGKTNIMDIPVETLRKQIIYIPQNPSLFNRTVYENINYENCIERKMIEQVINYLDLNNDLPLDKKVGKYGKWLSGGQRQIVYLLRCLFKDSSIILLDEPTSNLDSETKQKVLMLFDILFKHKTVILITHDKDILQQVDNILQL